jgi:hypothetical protein
MAFRLLFLKFRLKSVNKPIKKVPPTLLALVCSLFAFWSSPVIARQVTLAWDANTERNLGGYRVYYGLASRSYTSMIDVGNQTRYTISDLDDNRTYYFVVTAYNDRNTFESGFSNEVNTGGGLPVASHESPSEGSFESGVGLIRGWVCNAATVEVEIDGGVRLKAAHGTRRPDTEAVCGTADTGYGLTYNWNLLGDGAHTLRALADGVEFSRVSFYVTTLGHDYLRGLPAYEHALANFPSTGRNVTLRWSESHQNFVIVNN